MRKFIIHIVFLIFSLSVFSQQIKVSSFSNKKYAFKKWDARTLNMANTFKYTPYLSQEEKLVIFYINLARMNPKLFSQTFVTMYCDSFNVKSSQLRALLTKSKFARISSPLRLQKDLYQVARNHAISTGRMGEEGHLDFDKRYERAVKKYKSVGENLDYGHERALEIVVNMLLDDQNPDRTNRSNIYKRKYKFIGVAIKPHSTKGFTCVISFGEF
jgi:uncharacterized protein YkwD